MAKFYFAIAVKDEADLLSGHKRKKEGDIIAYKKTPFTGRKELKTHLIVAIDGLTEQQAKRMCSPFYPGGKYADELPIEDDGDIIDTISRTPIAKRRHTIPLNTLKILSPSIDITKIQDIEKEYQPLKDTNFNGVTTSMVYDKFTEKQIKPIDTTTKKARIISG